MRKLYVEALIAGLFVASSSLGILSGTDDGALAQIGPTLVQILPEHPTTADDIVIRLEGTWQNSCVPSFPKVTIQADQVLIGTFSPGFVCLQVLTGWSLDVPIGKLPAGTYIATVTYQQGPPFQPAIAPPTLIAMTSFEVISQECTLTVQPGESIQAAIDGAQEGAVICLAEGTWEEDLVIGRGLTVRGAGREESIVKGLKDGEPVILIDSDAEIEVTIAGLTVAGAKGEEYCAKWPLRCPYGLLLGGRAKVTLQWNTISGNRYRGISMVDSAQATVQGNIVSGNWDDGISMEGSAQATIEGNEISGNWYGVSMWDSTQATIRENTISGSEWAGIYVGGSAQVTIQGNTITDNQLYGVMLFQRPCFDTGEKFGGAVGGAANVISGNKESQVCPSPELDFLMAEEEGCYGPLCPVTPAPLEGSATLGP
jgi:parallel beta-helix repeat protein